MSFVALGDVPFIEQFRAKIKEVTERSDGEKMALLKLRRGNELAKACVELGRKVGWPEPSKADWRSLFACKLITREPPRDFIVLTATGLMWQARLAHAMAHLQGWHYLLPHGEDRFNVRARCTCGWSATFSKNEGNLISKQFQYFGVHLDKVEKGLWKPQRPAAEMIAEHFARAYAAQAVTTVPAQEPQSEKEPEHVET